jgi:hypothetical protein
MLAKKAHLEAAERSEAMFAEAIKVFSKYRGHDEEEDNEEYFDDYED